MKEELKQMVREKVAAGAGMPVPAPRPMPAQPATPVVRPMPLAMAAAVPIPDDLIIEITGDSGSATLTLRPFEVSRLRGRFGRGPGFEQWVADRVRDLLVSFGGG